RGLSTVATVLMPVWGFLIVCAVPLVALLFEHGSFTPADTQRTATAMLWYAPALLALGWREMVGGASYAVGDSRRPRLGCGFCLRHDHQRGRRFHPWPHLRNRRTGCFDFAVSGVRGRGQHLDARPTT